jgi:hypothetical protein
MLIFLNTGKPVNGSCKASKRSKTKDKSQKTKGESKKEKGRRGEGGIEERSDEISRSGTGRIENIKSPPWRGGGGFHK